MPQIKIFDFDGTLTDPEQEASPFIEAYLKDLSHVAGLPLGEVQVLAKKLEADIIKNPADNGWERNGMIVAPAAVDPYLRMNQVATKILEQAGGAEKDFISRLTDLFFQNNYPKSQIVFKDGAKELLESLKDTEVFVVTNSGTDPVQNKVRVLGTGANKSNSLEWLLSRIFGSAKKYDIDPSFTDVPPSLKIPGLNGREVLLRRRKYFNVLNRIRQQHNAEWDDIIVVGDIFELDLSLPLVLGAEIVLVVNEFTPDYEKRYIDRHPKGHLITRLSQISELCQ